MRKIVFIGGPRGVGKTKVIQKANAGSHPVIPTGKISKAAQIRLAKTAGWKDLSPSEQKAKINQEVLRHITFQSKKTKLIIIDSHYSYHGEPIFTKAELKHLAKETGASFLFVNISASRKNILLRILADTSKMRSHEIKKVREDILLNQKFYEEYRKILAKSTGRSISLWNHDVEETAKLLSGFIGDFLSDKWKNSFLIKK